MHLIWLGLIMQCPLINSCSGGDGLHLIPKHSLLAAGWPHEVTAPATNLLAGESTITARQAPVAVAHVSRNFYLPRPNSPVYVARLSAGFSTDADGEIVEFSWHVDGSSYRGAEIEIVSFHEPAALTRVQVQLTVRDNDGQASTLNTELVIANISVVSNQSPP